MKLIKDTSAEAKVPRISISQEEITADLNLPRAPASAAARPAPRGKRRRRSRAQRRNEEADATDVARAYAELSPETSRSRTLVWQDPVPTAAAGATMTGMEYMRAVVAARCRPRRSRW